MCSEQLKCVAVRAVRPASKLPDAHTTCTYAAVPRSAVGHLALTEVRKDRYHLLLSAGDQTADWCGA
jgi:hypothetical protein